MKILNDIWNGLAFAVRHPARSGRAIWTAVLGAADGIVAVRRW